MNFADSVILIIDDTPTNLAVLADYLGDYDFEIITALNGEDGLEKAELVKPHIILLDVMMPGIDGFETCRRLKANEPTKDIPIIFMTALANEEDKVRGFEAGAVDYVTKPIQQREVLARITTHLHMLELLREQKHQRQISDSLRNISRVLNSTLDQNRLLDKVMEQLGQVVPFDGASLFLHEEGQLRLSQGIGFAAQYVGGAVPLTDNSSGVAVFNSKKAMLIGDTKHDGRGFSWDKVHPIASWMGAPLLIEEDVIGVLTVDSFRVDKYGQADLAILQIFAHHAAGAIRNARLYSLTQQMNEQLRKLNTDKDKFFSIVAHDLKGPFMPLLGNAEILTEMGDILPPQEVKQMGHSIQRTARNVFSLLENLLAWARLQMGRMEYQPQRLDVAEIATKTVELLTNNAELKQIKLSNDVLAGTWVYADENMLDTVIRNLTNNALKFTRQGGEVKISARPVGEFVEVAIMDTGVGMSEAVQANLFKLDQHVTTVGTGKETGTGLGLIICQEMVVKGGGRIWVESELGKGTTVKFTVMLDKI